MQEETLAGGLTNQGAIVRVGRHVLRPSSPYMAGIHAFLRSVRGVGFDGVPRPEGVDPDGRERLEFLVGDVPESPYPAWSQSDQALTSIATLLRRLHDASAPFDPAGHSWNSALADPAGGQLICHNDLELSNIVFKDGMAVGFIDFEFAAPGRAVYDVAHLARLCVPIEHEVDQRRMGWSPVDRPARLRLIADGYGLDRNGRAQLLPAIDDALERIEQRARALFDSSDPAVVARIGQAGGIEKYDRRREWWRRSRHQFADALD